MKEGDVKTKPTLQDWGCLFTFFVLIRENRWSGFRARIPQVCLPSSMQMESIHEITAMDSLKSRGSVPTGMGSHSSLLRQTHHSNWHSGSWLCKAIPQCHPASKCKLSTCQPARRSRLWGPSVAAVRRAFSISLFGFIPMRILRLRLHRGEQLLEMALFGVSLVFFSFFSRNWQAQVRHYTYPQILGCQYSGASESCGDGVVRLSSHLDTSSRYGLPWWLR